MHALLNSGLLGNGVRGQINVHHERNACETSILYHSVSMFLPDDGLIQQSDLRLVMKACMEENGMKFDEKEIEDLVSRYNRKLFDFNRYLLNMNLPFTKLQHLVCYSSSGGRAVRGRRRAGGRGARGGDPRHHRRRSQGRDGQARRAPRKPQHKVSGFKTF